jgi:hypothetical protein
VAATPDVAEVETGEPTSANSVDAIRVEPMTGIEPAYSAWEVDSVPLRVSQRVCRLRTTSGNTSLQVGGCPQKLF